MDSEQKPAAECADDKGNLLALALLAPFAGAVAGFVAVIFRLALQWLDSFRGTVIGWAHGEAFAGFLFVVVLCAAENRGCRTAGQRCGPLATLKFKRKDAFQLADGLRRSKGTVRARHD